MSKEEILCTTYGEMQDLIVCYSIVFGGMEEKQHRYITDYEEAIKVR